MIRGCLLILAVAPSALLADDLDTVRPLLAKYCLRCHGAEEQQAQVRFDRFTGFDRSNEQLWSSVHEVLIGGEMPPKGEAQPTAEERQRLQVTMAKGCLHSESYGPEGAVTLFGRKK